MKENDIITDVVSEVVVDVPVIKAEEHTINTTLWTTLAQEINTLVARIDAGEELEPSDVKKAQTLRKQIGEYSTAFNVAVKNAQTTYKERLAKQLELLGYDKIENYITTQRQKQTQIQNDRLTRKTEMLTKIVHEALQKTIHVQKSVIANELISVFTARFPKIKSAAVNQEITDWTSYQTVITQALTYIDAFFNEPDIPLAVTAPIYSQTIGHILAFLRTGQLEELQGLKQIFITEDLPTLVQQQQRAILTEQIKTHDDALNQITTYLSEDMTSKEKIAKIAEIIQIATVLA